ncbi:MAG TPA: hypothetical protein VI454_14225, partial [Verrucomicrobiae bacterium]
MGLGIIGICATRSLASVSVTPASGGTNILADHAANAPSPAWTTLGPIIIDEGNKADIGSGTGRTLVLKAPAGFEFNTTAVPNITFTAGQDISSASVVINNSNTFTVTLTVSGTGNADVLTIGNTNHLQVRPTTGTPLAAGQIYRPATGGGTAVINGVATSTNADGSGGRNFGSLSETGGVVSKLTFTTQPGGATTGAPFGTQPVVRTRDQFGNDSTSDLPGSLDVSVALSAGTGPLLGTTNLNIGTNAGNGIASFNNLRIDVAGTDKQLTASAVGLASDASSVFVVNGRPSISSIGDLVTDEDMPPGPISFTIGDEETSVDALVLSVMSSNTNLVPATNFVFGGSGNNRTLTIIPATNGFGTNLITIAVGDGTASGSTSFLLTVNPINDPPTLNALTNRTIPEDPGMQTVNLTGISRGPPNESNQTITIIATSSDPGLIPNPAVNYTNPVANGTLTFTPLPNVSGGAVITVVVADNGGTTNGGLDSITNSFTVTVLSVNDPPTLNALTNLTLAEDAGPQIINLAGIGPGAPDESGQTVTITATSSNPLLVPNPTVNYANPDTTGTLTLAPLTNQSGTAVITVVAHDDGGTTNGGVNARTNSFTVTVLAVNDSPAMNVLTNLTILEDAGTQTVNLSGISRGPTNENSQTLTITATSDNPGLIPNPTVNYTNPATSGTLAFAPLTNQSGAAVITVVVRDNGGTTNGGIDSITNSFAVTVLPLNDRPTMNALTNLTLFEDAGTRTVNLAGISPGPADEAGQVLTITATSSSPGFIADPTVSYTNPASTGSLTFAVPPEQSGSAVITVVVRDDGGANNGGVDALTNSFVVTVIATNDQPTLDALTNLTILEDAGTQTTSLTGISAGATNETNQIITVTASSSNTGLIPNPTVTYTNPNTAGTLIWAPATNQSGTAVISVVVQDNGGTTNGGKNSITNSFTVTVLAINDPPTMNALTNRTIVEDAPLQTVSLTGISAGPNESGQTNTITATSSNPGLIPNPAVNYTNPASTGTLTFAPLSNLYGSAVITVVLTDSGGTTNGGIDSITNSFTVTVLAANDRPTMNALTNLTILEEAGTQTVNLTGIGPGPADESGQAITLTATSSNPGLIPNPTVNYTSPDTTGTLGFAPLANQSGTAVITVVVRDDGGTTNGGIDALTNSFTVTVVAVNDSPAMDALTNLTILEDAGTQTVNLTGISRGPSNESGQTITITATSSDGTLITNPTVNYTNPATTGTMTFAPLTNQFGSAVITVVVKDNGGTTNGGVDAVTNSFSVTVLPVNDRPTLNTLTNLVIVEDAGSQIVNLGGIGPGATNESSQSVAITATSSNPGLIPDPIVNYTNPGFTGTFTFAAATNQSGSAVITVIVQDDGGTVNGGIDARTNAFTITVLSKNDQPTLDALTDVTILEEAGTQTVSLTGISAGSSNEFSQTLTVTASSSNPGLIPNPT